jgi:hypothetical protein
MQEQAQMLKPEAVGAEPSAALPPETRRPNAGWFRPADARINREGRPRGSRKVALGVAAEDRATQADRLGLLRFPGGELLEILGYRLGRHWPDGQIVGARVDSATGELVLALRSPIFARVATGALIPPL